MLTEKREHTYIVCRSTLQECRNFDIDIDGIAFIFVRGDPPVATFYIFVLFPDYNGGLKLIAD